MNIDEMNLSLPFEQRWENLTIANDFMFGKVFQDLDLSLELVRRILPELNIERITLHERQKSAHETLDTYGVRFDVYLHDDKGRIIILEMQIANVKYLAKRSRAYHSATDLDARERDKYKRYEEMPEVYVIFICDFDPFGLRRYVYMFKKFCCEAKELALEDGTSTIFLSTKGHDKEVSSKLKAFIDFVGGKSSNDEFIRQLERRLMYAKHNWEWRRNYVLDTLERNSLIYDVREQGIAQGIEQGIAQGIVLGREQGIVLGKEQGIVLGKEQGIILGKEQGIALGKEQGRIETVEDTVRLLLEHGMNADQIESIKASLLNTKGE